jgi:hypothetical protein
MSDDHQHIWAKGGCWCGARCCVYFGYDTVDGAFGGLRFCDQARAPDSEYCPEHQRFEINYDD